MSYFDDARVLLDHAREDLTKIHKEYEASLSQKAIKPTLLVEIKNLMENLRSALDFSAHGLFDKYGSSTKKNPRIYFPYATADQDLSAFRRANRIDVCIPGLAATRPDIVTLIEDLQHFGRASMSWVPDFMALNNENKHQRLTPQVRRESKELRISGGGASIGLGQGASISIGRGASISIGGAVIRGGQTFDVNNPPVVQGGKTEVITWVSFDFEEVGRPVLPLLTEAVRGVGEILDELESA